MEIFRTFKLDAAHNLTGVPEDHPCRKMHGHTYRVTVHVSGDVEPDTGWVMDFGDLRAACKPVIDELDHGCLNSIEGLENPTSERLAMWLWKRLQDAVPGLARITVMESADTGCVYQGELE